MLGTLAQTKKTSYIRTPKETLPFARMAELVDALVSNTSDSNIVPVRPRLRVHQQAFSH